MLLFHCEFTHNELTALRKNLPEDQYCIIGGPGERDHYGIMHEGLHGRLMEILSGETLTMLEYVDENELRELVSKGTTAEIIGNGDLIDQYRE